MRNIGYTVKADGDGYYAEYFAMNSQTFDVQVIERRGPFAERSEAVEEVKVMRWESDHDA